MKNFVIVMNSSKENSEECAETIKNIIEKNGCVCTACLFSQENTGEGDYLYTNPELVPEETEAIISVGGDGTFIHASKDLIDLDLPVFGVNFGTLGYLTEVDVNGFEGALKSIVEGDYQIEERMLIRCDIEANGKVVHSGIALNDIVLQRSLDTGIGQYDVYVNNRFLNYYSADGIILSTPTGSTGYNLSAGGPVVMPTAEIVLMTPICAHTLNSRTVVIPAKMEIEMISKIGSREKKQESYVTIDGEKGIKLEEGDKIIAKKARRVAKIIKINKDSFIENLGKKMRY